jgi:hypothetical protein
MADKGKETFIGSLWSKAKSSSKSRSGGKSADSHHRPAYSDGPDQSGYFTSRPSGSKPRKSPSPVTNILKGVASGIRGKKPKSTVRPGTKITIQEPREWPTRTPSDEDPEEEGEDEILPRVSVDEAPLPSRSCSPSKDRQRGGGPHLTALTNRCQ